MVLWTMAKFPKSQKSQLDLLLANENRMAISSSVYQRLAQTNAPFMAISDVAGAETWTAICSDSDREEMIKWIISAGKEFERPTDTSLNAHFVATTSLRSFRSTPTSHTDTSLNAHFAHGHFAQSPLRLSYISYNMATPPPSLSTWLHIQGVFAAGFASRSLPLTWDKPKILTCFA